MILWRAIADGMHPICSEKSMPSWSDCVKECGTGATQRAEETNGASHCALKLPDLLPQFCCSRAVPRGDPLARARPGVPRQCRRGVAVLVLQVQTGSAGLWADPIPTFAQPWPLWTQSCEERRQYSRGLGSLLLPAQCPLRVGCFSLNTRSRRGNATGMLALKSIFQLLFASGWQNPGRRDICLAFTLRQEGRLRRRSSRSRPHH